MVLKMDLKDNYIQTTIFDIKPIVKRKESICEKSEFKYKKFTIAQFKVYKKFLKSNKVLRVIYNCGGGIFIEIIDNGITSNYVNKDGKIEFKFKGVSCVLPKDRVLYYSPLLKIKTYKIQAARLKELVKKYGRDIKQVIKRKGDFNIIVQHVDGRVFSIIPKGWVLEFFTVKSIECEKGEILNINFEDYFKEGD